MSAIKGNEASPANQFVAITPGDTSASNLTVPSRAIYVGVGGDIAAVSAKDGNVVVFSNVQTGSLLPIEVTRVNATSTTATNLVSVF